MRRAAAILGLCALLPLTTQCRLGGYNSITYSKEKLATPPTTLSQRDYPFDEKGRYRTDWVKSGSTSRRSLSDFRTVAAAQPQTKKTQTAPSQTSRTASSSPSRTQSTSVAAASSSTPAPRPPAPSTTSSTPSPKPPPPSPPKKKARYHTIAKGDTLWGISQRYKISVPAIKSANGLSSDLIRPGQVLRLP